MIGNGAIFGPLLVYIYPPFHGKRQQLFPNIGAHYHLCYSTSTNLQSTTKLEVTKLKIELSDKYQKNIFQCTSNEH